MWRTTNADLTNPGATIWEPLTQQFPSLSISALAFSPLDPSNDTLFAGTGQFSNKFDGGNAIGLLRTTDGGDSWEAIASYLPRVLSVKAVAGEPR